MLIQDIRNAFLIDQGIFEFKVDLSGGYVHFHLVDTAKLSKGLLDGPFAMRAGNVGGMKG
jgi:hypothetical protein